MKQLDPKKVGEKYSFEFWSKHSKVFIDDVANVENLRTGKAVGIKTAHKVLARWVKQREDKNEPITHFDLEDMYRLQFGNEKGYQQF